VVGANTTDYVLDGSMFVRDLLNGMVKATYLVGPRGPEYRRDDQAGTIRWYVCDGMGSVVGEVAPDGTLTRSQSFDVYGCVRTSSGTATTKHKFVGALGHPSDDETGLIYLRARHYDPVTGRFVSEDPKGHGANWFAYSHSNPTCAGDRTGREDFSLVETTVTTDISAAMDSVGADLVMLDGEVTTDLIGGVTEMGTPNPEFASWLIQRGLDPQEFIYAAKEIAGAGGQVLKAWLRVNLETAEYLSYLESDTAFAGHATPYVGTLL
jgi:RHS repeat-associated protein